MPPSGAVCGHHCPGRSPRAQTLSRSGSESHLPLAATSGLPRLKYFNTIPTGTPALMSDATKASFALTAAIFKGTRALLEYEIEYVRFGPLQCVSLGPIDSEIDSGCWYCCCYALRLLIIGQTRSFRLRNTAEKGRDWSCQQILKLKI